MGHKVDKSKQISEKITEEHEIVGTKEEEEITVNWLSELFADLFSVRILGPAFPISFISYCLSLPSSNTPQVSHPADSIRISIQKEYLYEEMNLGSIDFLESYMEFFKAHIDKLSLVFSDQNSPTNLPEPICSVEKMINLIKPELENLNIGMFSRENLENSRILADELSKGIPINAVRPSEKEMKKKYKEIEKKLSECTPGDERIKSILHEVLQSPSKICEILNAGWIDRQRNGSETFKKSFINQDISTDEIYRKAFRDYSDHVFERDIILLKSIEASRIHQIYRRDV